MKKIKKWNWTVFVVCMSGAMIGSLSNHNMRCTNDAILFGLLGGLLVGLPAAFFTRDEY